MGFIAAKCTQCGANIQVDESKDAGICSHCNTAFVTEKAINNYNSFVTNNHNYAGATIVGDNELKKWLDAATGFEKLGDIESACKTYKKITQEYPQEFDGWLGLTSCCMHLSVENKRYLSPWEIEYFNPYDYGQNHGYLKLSDIISAAKKLATPDQIKMIDEKMIEYNKNVDQILLKKLEESRNKIRNTYKSIDDLYAEMLKLVMTYVGNYKGQGSEHLYEIRPDKKRKIVYLSKKVNPRNNPKNNGFKYVDEYRTLILGLSSDNMLLLKDDVRKYEITIGESLFEKGKFNVLERDRGSIPLSESCLSKTFHIIDKTENELIIRIDNELVKFTKQSVPSDIKRYYK